MSLGKGRHIGWTRAPVEKVPSGQIKNHGGPKVQNTTETQHSLFLFSHHCIMLECYSQQCPCVTFVIVEPDKESVSCTCLHVSYVCPVTSYDASSKHADCIHITVL